ncbi:MAG: hypothetical protein ACTSQP_09175 [Promethearchaeota archaeon]
MNIWILDSKKGINLLFKSFLQIPVDKDIVSGLLTAFNQFTTAEFQQSIESIEMGGLRWIYLYVPETDLLFVASDTKDVDASTLKARLEIIQDAFLSKYKDLWEQRGNSWEGDLHIFSPFEEIIEDYYFQWKDAEIITTLANFFDLLRAFQQILNIIRSIIEILLNEEEQEKIYFEIERIFNKFKTQPEIINDRELNKISFSKERGFKVIDLNPMNCDPVMAKENLKNIIVRIVRVFKNTFGEDKSMILFKKGGIFDYIYENLDFLKYLRLDHFLLKLFLLVNV